MAAMRSASSTLPRPGRVDGQIIGLTLLIKFGLLIFGVVVVALVGRIVAPDLDGMSADPRPLFEPWVRWDAPHYLDLAVFGYRATVGGELFGPDGYRAFQPADLPFYGAFYPLFPWLIAGVVVPTHDPSLASFIVSGIALCIAGPLLFRLVSLETSPAVGFRAVWFLLIFPTAYFLQISYTESLFLAASSLGRSCRPDRTVGGWPASSVPWLAMTRINGLILIPALIVEAWSSGGRGAGRSIAGGCSSAVPLGPLVTWPSTRPFLRGRLRVPGAAVGALAQGAERPVGRHRRPPPIVPAAGMDPGVAFVALGIVATIACIRRYPASWTVWMVGNLLLFTSTSLILSVPRYDLMLFPMFAWFGSLASTTPRLIVMSAVSLAGLAFFEAGSPSACGPFEHRRSGADPGLALDSGALRAPRRLFRVRFGQEGAGLAGIEALR